MAELQERTPTLLSLMSAVADKTWNWKTMTVPAKCALQVCVACAILMKSRNMHMCCTNNRVTPAECWTCQFTGKCRRCGGILV